MKLVDVTILTKDDGVLQEYHFPELTGMVEGEGFYQFSNVMSVMLLPIDVIQKITFDIEEDEEDETYPSDGNIITLN